jgi:hypothetical protein
MPCALPIVDPPIAERTQPSPIDLAPRGIRRCEEPRAGFSVTQKEAEAAAVAAAREYHGTIKSNQRWLGPGWMNSARSPRPPLERAHVTPAYVAALRCFFLRGEFPL